MKQNNKQVVFYNTEKEWTLAPKKVKGQKTALKSLVTVLKNLAAQLH